jgi:hypothetical protein
MDYFFPFHREAPPKYIHTNGHVILLRIEIFEPVIPPYLQSIPTPKGIPRDFFSYGFFAYTKKPIAIPQIHSIPRIRYQPKSWII